MPRKGEEEGWPAKGAKRKKGRVKTAQTRLVGVQRLPKGSCDNARDSKKGSEKVLGRVLGKGS